MEDIFISKRIPIGDHQIVIEGDQHTIWAYIFLNKKILFDGFLCSRGTLIDNLDEVKMFIDKSCAPPLAKSFSNKFSIQKEVTKDDFSIECKESIVHISINGIEFLRMDIINKKSYSLGVLKEGPYGYPIDMN